MIGLQSLGALRSFNVVFDELIDELFDCRREF